LSSAKISGSLAGVIVEAELDHRPLAERLDLDLAVWGHISDGNVHPNVIPHRYEDVERGRELILELAGRVIAMGGSPLAEHGVGRNAVKQRLWRCLMVVAASTRCDASSSASIPRGSSRLECFL